MQAWAKDHGLKLKEDKHLSKNVRMVVATNEHLGCGDITLVVGLRGTDTASGGSTEACLQRCAWYCVQTQ